VQYAWHAFSELKSIKNVGPPTLRFVPLLWTLWRRHWTLAPALDTPNSSEFFRQSVWLLTLLSRQRMDTKMCTIPPVHFCDTFLLNSIIFVRFCIIVNVGIFKHQFRISNKP